MSFDGARGVLEQNGSSDESNALGSAFGLAYNRCELNVAGCGVKVERLPNVSLDGRQFYALEAASIANPSTWYTVLLDRDTFLPYAIWAHTEAVYFSDYAPVTGGELYPTTWRYDHFNEQWIVTHALEVH